MSSVPPKRMALSSPMPARWSGEATLPSARVSGSNPSDSLTPVDSQVRAMTTAMSPADRSRPLAAAPSEPPEPPEPVQNPCLTVLIHGASLVAPVGMVLLAHFNTGILTSTSFSFVQLLPPVVVGVVVAVLLQVVRHAHRTTLQLSWANARLSAAARVSMVQQQELERAIAEAKTRAVGQLVAVGAVHDLRNAMSVVRLVGEEQVYEAGGDPELGELLMSSADQAVSLCERVLNAYRGNDFKPVELEMGPTIGAMAADFGYLVGPQGSVQTVVGHGRVLVDRFDLFQIFQNVITNSCRASGGNACIQVKSRQVDDRYLIRFRDRGPGFPPSMLQRHSPVADGTHGFGLNIIRALVERNRGHVVLSNYADGAEVTIELPILRKEEPGSLPGGRYSSRSGLAAPSPRLVAVSGPGR